jgi:hypothetical protein
MTRSVSCATTATSAPALENLTQYRPSRSSTSKVARWCQLGKARPPSATVRRDDVSRRGMYTPATGPSGVSHSAAIRWAAFSVVTPTKAGMPAGRTSPSRMRHTPAIAKPSTRTGLNGGGRRAPSAAGSTR